IRQTPYRLLPHSTSRGPCRDCLFLIGLGKASASPSGENRRLDHHLSFAPRHSSEFAVTAVMGKHRWLEAVQATAPSDTSSSPAAECKPPSCLGALSHARPPSRRRPSPLELALPWGTPLPQAVAHRQKAGK